MRRLTGLGFLTACVLSGCIGYVSDPERDGDGHNGSQGPAACTAGELAALPTRRLTRYEYDNTLRAVLGPDVFAALENTISVVPQDRTSDVLDTLSQQPTMSHVQAYFAVAEAIGEHFASSETSRSGLHGCFDAADWARPCIEQMLEALGPRVLRRALDPEDGQRLLALYDKTAPDGREHGLHAVLSALFLAPDFLYRLEVRGELEEDLVTLTGRELANRLAYALWGEPPDEQLVGAAESGALDSDDGLRQQVDRLLVDPRARRHFAHFAEQWLLLDHVDDVENPPEYVRDGLDTSDLNAAVQTEIALLVEHVVWERKADYGELMSSPLSFVTGPALASIYGVSESSDAPIELPPERAGLLTRLAFLANADGVSDPIHRGKRVRTQLLCGELQQPDPSTLPAGSLEPPAPDAELTTRERVAQKTASPECKACHDLINPLGFAMEDYDGLGRHRSVEKIHDPAGALLAELPIDASVDPMFEKSGDRFVTGAAELSQALAEDPRAVRCLTTQYLEYAMGRKTAANDACTVDMLSTGGPIIGLISGYTLLPGFRVKRIDDEAP